MTQGAGELRAKLKRGEPIGLMWSALGSPAVAEQMASTRPDAFVFDLQHGLWSRDALEHGIAAVRGYTVPLVRTMSARPEDIGPALDAGAQGVIVPLIEDAATAAQAVRATLYPPDGERSGGGLRPLLDFKGYVAASRANPPLVLPMIETAAGLEALEAVAAVPGIDGLFVGTGDLALSIGTFPEFDSRHARAVEQVLAAAERAGIAGGVFTPHEALGQHWRAKGALITTVAADNELLRNGAEAAQRRFLPTGGVDPVKGAVAFVTGTSRGIGPEIVAALAAAGAKKIYCASRAGGALRASCETVAVTLDVTDPAAIARAAEAAPDVTLLINNAGVNFNSGLMHGNAIAQARTEIETNYLGPLMMAHAFAPALARNKGVMVNILSILAEANLPAMGSLCASKAAALSMTQGLRAELAPKGIRVMAVLPGAVDTDMSRDFPGDKLPPAEVARTLVWGLQTGAEDLYVGTMAAGVKTGLLADAKKMEREFAGYLPTY